MSQTPTTYQPYTPGRPGPEELQRDHQHDDGPNCLVIASVVCVVVWAMSGFGYFWPIWVLLPTLLFGRPVKNVKAAAGVSGHLRRRFRS